MHLHAGNSIDFLQQLQIEPDPKLILCSHPDRKAPKLKAATPANGGITLPKRRGPGAGSACCPSAQAGDQTATQRSTACRHLTQLQPNRQFHPFRLYVGASLIQARERYFPLGKGLHQNINCWAIFGDLLTAPTLSGILWVIDTRNPLFYLHFLSTGTLSVLPASSTLSCPDFCLVLEFVMKRAVFLIVCLVFSCSAVLPQRHKSVKP